MIVVTPAPEDFSDAWVEGDPSARWRSTTGHGPSTGAQRSGSSILEVEPGCRLAPHTDSAEETIAVVAGTAEVVVEGRASRVSAGGLAVVPAGTVHEVRCADTGPLRFIAVYAGTDVVTRYEAEVQPDCSRERRPIA